jgi:hypothetical protein
MFIETKALRSCAEAAVRSGSHRIYQVSLNRTFYQLDRYKKQAVSQRDTNLIIVLGNQRVVKHITWA